MRSAPYLLPLFVFLVIAALDRTNAVSGRRVGIGAGPTKVAYSLTDEFLVTADWNTQAVGVRSVRTPGDSVSIPAGCVPILATPSMKPNEILFACNYAEWLGVISLGGSRPAVRKLMGGSIVLAGAQARDCFIVAVVPLSQEEVFLVRVHLGSRGLNLFDKWWVERVRIERNRLVAVAASTPRHCDFVSIGAWCARLDDSTGDLWVSDPPNDAVVVFDASLGSCREVAVPGFPRAMALDPEGRRLYVASELSGEVSVIPFDRPAPGTVARRWVGRFPVDLEWDGTRGLLALLRGDWELLVLDPDDLSPKGRTKLPFRPWDLVLVPATGALCLVGEGSGAPVEIPSALPRRGTES